MYMQLEYLNKIYSQYAKNIVLVKLYSILLINLQGLNEIS